MRSMNLAFVTAAAVIGIREAQSSIVDVALGDTSGHPLSADSAYGILLARVGTGSWGFVCDDYFNWNAARAACKQLGLAPRRAAVSYSSDAQVLLSSTTFTLDNVVCSSSDEELNSCSYSTSHNCGASEGVSLSCQASAIDDTSWEVAVASTTGDVLPSSSSGVLAIREQGSSDDWMPVCPDGFRDSAAAAACGALGYPPEQYKRAVTSQSVSWSDFGASPTVSDLVCKLGAQDLRGGSSNDECAWIMRGPATSSSRDACDSTQAVHLDCDSTGLGTLGGVQFELVQQSGASQSDTLLSGYLAATVGLTRGFVCDDSFDSVSAAVVCSQLFGFPSSRALTVTTSSTVDLSPPITDFSVDDLRCSSSENYLQDCSWSTNHNCGSSEGIQVTCTTPIAPSSLSVGIVPDAAAHLGLTPSGSVTQGVLVAADSSLGTPVWVPVCATALGSLQASAVCEAAGYSGSAGQWVAQAALPVTDGLYRYGLTGCSAPGSGDSTGSCAGSIYTQCSGNYPAGIRCYAAGSGITSDSLELGLLDGDSRTRSRSALSAGFLAARTSTANAFTPICADGWDLDSAAGTCSLLGFSVQRDDISWATAPRGLLTSLRHLNCPSTASSTSQCLFSPTITCSSDKLILLRCGTDAPQDTSVYKFGLASNSGSSTPDPDIPSGTLLASGVGNSGWGTVCDDNWAAAETYFACYMLGFGRNSPIISYSTVNTGTVRFAMDNVDCEIDADSFADCSWSNSHNCGSSEGQFIDCGSFSQVAIAAGSGSGDVSGLVVSLARTSSPGPLDTQRRVGVLAARVSGTGNLNPVCADGFTTQTAAVSCRNMGFIIEDNAVRWATFTASSSAFTGISCPASAELLSSCTVLSSTTCSSRTGVFVMCGDPQPPTDSAAEEFALASPTGELEPSTGLVAGTLIARLSSSGPWQPVCDDAFGEADAHLVCYLLGFGEVSPVATYTTSVNVGTGDFSMDDLNCPSDALSVDDCTFNSRDNCGAGEGVTVDCGLYASSTGGGGSGTIGALTFRLRSEGDSRPYVPGDSNVLSSGILEASVNGGAFGPVCDDSFGQSEAQRICVALGFAGASDFDTAVDASGGNDFTVDDLSCSSVGACYYSTNDNCGLSSEGVRLTCDGGSGGGGGGGGGGSSSVDVFRDIRRDADIMSGFAIGFLGMSALSAFVVFLAKDDGEEMPATCAVCGSWQSMAVVLGVLSVDIEIARAYSILRADTDASLSEYNELQAAVAGLVLFSIAALLTWYVNSLTLISACSSGDASDDDFCEFPPLSACIGVHSMVSMEGALCWAVRSDDFGLNVYSGSTSSRDSCWSFIARMAAVRLLILEIPHIIIFAWLRGRFGSWFSLNVGIAAASLSLIFTLLRLIFWISDYDSTSTFGAHLDCPCCNGDDAQPANNRNQARAGGPDYPQGQGQQGQGQPRTQITASSGGASASSSVSRPPANAVSAPKLPVQQPSPSAPPAHGGMYPPPVQFPSSGPAPAPPGFTSSAVNPYGGFSGTNPQYAGGGQPSAEAAKTAAASYPGGGGFGAGSGSGAYYGAPAAGGLQPYPGSAGAAGAAAGAGAYPANPYGSPYGAYGGAPNASAGAWNVGATGAGPPASEFSGAPGYDPYRPAPPGQWNASAPSPQGQGSSGGAPAAAAGGAAQYPGAPAGGTGGAAGFGAAV